MLQSHKTKSENLKIGLHSDQLEIQWKNLLEWPPG